MESETCRVVEEIERPYVIGSEDYKCSRVASEVQLNLRRKTDCIRKIF